MGVQFWKPLQITVYLQDTPLESWREKMDTMDSLKVEVKNLSMYLICTKSHFAWIIEDSNALAMLPSPRPISQNLLASCF